MSSDEMPTFAGLLFGGGSKGRPKKKPAATRQVPEAPLSLLLDFPVASEIMPKQEISAERLSFPGPNPRHEEAPVRPVETPALKSFEANLSPAPPQVWGVAELVRAVRELVERDYRRVIVEGEISNWRPANSGHCYFTLKDGDAQLSAVMFRGKASLLRFRPKDGDAVRLRGQLSVYENRGQMQIIAESMELAGQGALLAAVQALKERLRLEGLFERKRPLPTFPRCIGVVTSLQGAALRDILKVCRRRHAAVNLLIYPAAVQGPDCAKQVIAGLRWFSRHKDRADVVLVARGGGSWEDLHGFDDEGVARAIVACELPVMTGIGHATDTTIADAAADVCAPTPSAAAELVTAAHHRVEERVQRLQMRIMRAGRYELLRARQRLFSTGAENLPQRAAHSVRRREQRVDELGFRTGVAAERLLRMHAQRLQKLEQRLRGQNVGVRLMANKQRLSTLQFRLISVAASTTSLRRQQTERCTSRLEALNPLRVLDRGYALVYAPGGSLLRDSNAVTQGDMLTVRVARGTLSAAVVDRTSDKP